MKITKGILAEIASCLRYHSKDNECDSMTQALGFKDWGNKWGELMENMFPNHWQDELKETGKISRFESAAKYLDNVHSLANSDTELFLYLTIGWASFQDAMERAAMSHAMTGVQKNIRGMLDQLLSDDEE